MSERYAALALQLTAQSVETCADRAAAAVQMQAQIATLGRQLRGIKVFVEQYSGLLLRLVVLPEYWLTSYPGRIGIAEFATLAALAPDGPEYTALGRIAQDAGVHLAVNAYETDAHFPGLYFQASVILSPAGDVVLRYRRLNSMYAPTPHDVWSKYLDIYGLDGVFPVAATAIGKLAAIASEEILYPEIARAHALRGAEVFVHSSSEIGSPNPTAKHIARRARAIENLAWVVSANTAGIAGTGLPLASADGNSAIISPRGAVLAEANAGETFTAFAEIDLAASRAQRRLPGMTNMLARQRLELFAAAYAGQVQPADGLGNGQVPGRDYFQRTHEAVIKRLDEAGLI